MSKPLVHFDDVEHLVVDILTNLVQGLDVEPTVSVGVPDNYVAVSSPPHLEVAWDGTPTARWPVLTRCTVRIVARAATTTDAKALAARTLELLLDDTGWAFPISSIQFLTGILADRDPASRAELAAFTVQVNVRSTLAE